jgi:hypothetical protein
MCITKKIHTEKFNQEDVAYLIGKLKTYRDDYSKKLVTIFNRYVKHEDFEKLHQDLFKLEDLLDQPLPDTWDTDAHMGYLEVIYPV